MPKSGVSGVWLGGWVVLVTACSTSVPSEQVVRRNMPGDGLVATKATLDKPALSPAAKPAAAPAAAGDSDKQAITSQAITSQAVEKELNRLEAELGQR